MTDIAPTPPPPGGAPAAQACESAPSHQHTLHTGCIGSGTAGEHGAGQECPVHIPLIPTTGPGDVLPAHGTRSSDPRQRNALCEDSHECTGLPGPPHCTTHAHAPPPRSGTWDACDNGTWDGAQGEWEGRWWQPCVTASLDGSDSDVEGLWGPHLPGGGESGVDGSGVCRGMVMLPSAPCTAAVVTLSSHPTAGVVLVGGGAAAGAGNQHKLGQCEHKCLPS